MALTTWPPRCYTCNYLICLRKDEYENYIREGLSRREALDALGLQTMCCRKMVMSIPKYAAGFDVPIVEGPETRRIITRTAAGAVVPIPQRVTPKESEVAAEKRIRIRVYSAL